MSYELQAAGNNDSCWSAQFHGCALSVYLWVLSHNTAAVLCYCCGSSNNSALSYALILIGQGISAIAFPIIVYLPAAVAAIWFPAKERDMVTTLGALFCYSILLDWLLEKNYQLFC